MSKYSWDPFYRKGMLWRNRRAHQLKIEPLCRFCRERGLIAPATVVDHIEPHNGDWNKFARGAIQSLCKPCHDQRKRIADRRGYDLDFDECGNPLDPRHPSYTRQPGEHR